MADAPSFAAPSAPALSVVIPLGPGEREVDGLLAQLRRLPPPAEVILMYMGDSEPPHPAGWPVGCLEGCPEGCPDGPGLRQVGCDGDRARQMNAGAGQARGAWLWFLHADTRLLPGSLDALAAFLARDLRALGWFRLAFRGDGPALTRLNALGANWRARWLGVPFGDQGFVIRRPDFLALGGFDETAAYGEDHLFVWTAREAGIPACPVGGRVATSARKYARNGWARTTLLHWRLTFEQAWPAWRRVRGAARPRRRRGPPL